MNSPKISLNGYRNQSIEEYKYAQLIADKQRPLIKKAELGFTLNKIRRSTIDLSSSALLLLKQLVLLTKAMDWEEAKGWPLVWISNVELLKLFDWNLSTLKAKRAELLKKGFMTLHDRGNGRRWGRRGSTGHVIEGCGFDLSILAHRFAELKALYNHQCREDERLKSLKSLCSFKQRQIITETKWLNLEEGELFQKDARHLYKQFKRDMTLEKGLMIEQALCDLQARLQEAINQQQAIDQVNQDNIEDTLNQVVDEVYLVEENHPKGVEIPPPLYNTSTDLSTISKIDVVNAVNNSRNHLREDLPLNHDTSGPDILNGFRLTPTLILTIAPTFRDWITAYSTGWPDLIEASHKVCKVLGISPTLWQEVCYRFGAKQAVALLAATDARFHKGEIKSIGGFVRALIRRYRQGTLHLDRTLYGLNAQCKKNNQKLNFV